MKNVLKNPLKLIAVAMFVVAMGFGMSTSLVTSEADGDIDLLALNVSFAQGEGGGSGFYEQVDFCGNYTPGCNIWVIKCRYTGGPSCDVSSQWPCSYFCG